MTSSSLMWNCSASSTTGTSTSTASLSLVGCPPLPPCSAGCRRRCRRCCCRCCCRCLCCCLCCSCCCYRDGRENCKLPPWGVLRCFPTASPPLHLNPTTIHESIRLYNTAVLQTDRRTVHNERMEREQRRPTPNYTRSRVCKRKHVLSAIPGQMCKPLCLLRGISVPCGVEKIAWLCPSFVAALC